MIKYWTTDYPSVNKTIYINESSVSWPDLQKSNGLTIFSAISCPLNEMALCLEIRAYFYLTQLFT